MKKKILASVGIGVFLALIGVGIFGEHGLFRLRKLKADRLAMEQEKQALAKENQGLSKRIEMLKNDLKYLEQQARKKLGMIRPDEVIIKLPEQEPRPEPQKDRPPRPDQTEESKN